MPDAPKPFHNPFEALRRLRGEPAEPDAPAPGPDAAAPGPGSAPEPAPPESPRGTIARAVVRIERSGRRGKEVTVVEHLGLPPADLERWLRELKSALGCGGSVEGAAIALQGDHRKRLPPLLTARGVRRVTAG